MVISRILKRVILLSASLGLIIFAFVFRGQQLQEPEATVSPQPSPEATAGEATPTLSFVPTLTPVRTPTPSIKITNPAATCQLAGSINFINDDLYETRGAKISYQNVDDTIRQIYWKTNPDDGALVVGPNLFEQLVIPNGERQVGVSLIKSTNVKSYLLTAQVTYGIRGPNGGEIGVRLANCSGSVIVNMP